MPGFKLVKGYDDDDVLVVGSNSTIIVVGDVMFKVAGATYYTLGTVAAVAGQRKVICTKAAVVADDNVQGIQVHPGQLYEVETANNSNTAHNGHRIVLTDANTVNNTGTDDSAGVVTQEAIIGAVGDKKITVKFIDSNG